MGFLFWSGILSIEPYYLAMEYVLSVLKNIDLIDKEANTYHT